MDPLTILYAHYAPGSPLTKTLIDHSIQVRDKALEIAARLSDRHPDSAFIAEAAMLHDIGIGQTAARKIGCKGDLPYVCHGVAGRNLLDQIGLPLHALVCERHVGVGITKADIKAQQLPLPMRDMRPVSLEETIICYADKFFSKKAGGEAHSIEAILSDLASYGDDKVERFLRWHEQFELAATDKRQSQH